MLAEHLYASKRHGKKRKKKKKTKHIKINLNLTGKFCSEWREYVSGVSKVQSTSMRLKVGEHSLSKGDLPDEASAALLPVSPQLLSCTFFTLILQTFILWTLTNTSQLGLFSLPESTAE